jgi:hypothetical protein
VRPFEIGLIVYAATFMPLGLWAALIAKRRTGTNFNLIFTSPKEFAALVTKDASSPWDPFGDRGFKRWRLILFAEFAILVLLDLFAR